MDTDKKKSKSQIPNSNKNSIGTSCDRSLSSNLFGRLFFRSFLLSGFCFLLCRLASAQTNWSFRNHVQPVLAKNGCSAGACHGAAAGQNGFKLSLRGYDDEGDYLTLTRGALGRRIVPSDPGRSLMLLKPSGALPHKGGKRFDVDSLDYRITSQWIAAGTPGPKPDDSRISRLEVLPKRAVLRLGVSQQLSVRAIF